VQNTQRAGYSPPREHPSSAWADVPMTEDHGGGCPSQRGSSTPMLGHASLLPLNASLSRHTGCFCSCVLYRWKVARMQVTARGARVISLGECTEPKVGLIVKARRGGQTSGVC
jgi:hypothetical protein